LPAAGTAADPTHVDRVSVPIGTALPLTNAINQKLTGGQSIWGASTIAGATLTISGAVAA